MFLCRCCLLPDKHLNLASYQQQHLRQGDEYERVESTIELLSLAEDEQKLAVADLSMLWYVQVQQNIDLSREKTK
jgi:hypothetical protein